MEKDNKSLSNRVKYGRHVSKSALQKGQFMVFSVAPAHTPAVFKRILCLTFFCAFAISFSGCSVFYNKFYTDPDKCYKEALVKKPFDAAIVPGFPHQKDNWSQVVKGRVYWALFLYKHGMVKNIIFSGSAVYSPYIESEVMALYAQELGIPKECIFTEIKAEHSTENLYYSYELAKNKGFKTIVLATDPAQSSFLKSFKRKFKLDLQFIPILYDTLKVMNKTDPDIEEEKAFVPGFIPITEREGIFKRLRGTRGHVIKKMIRKSKKLQRKKKNISNT
jgi:uncharacterized SAM-binding protein YcdF (DUF218 family)